MVQDSHVPRATLTKKARQVLVAQAIRDRKAVGQIADELGVHRNTIGRDIGEITATVAAWADGDIHESTMAAMANYQWVMDAARTAFEQDRGRLDKWLAGAYDRVEMVPDPDGGMREVRKPPILRLETGAYLSQFISANQKLTKMVGLEGADKHEVTGKDGADLFGRMSDADVLRALALDETARCGQGETP